MRAVLLALAVAISAVGLAGCDAPTPSKAVEGNAGTLTWGVGSTKGELRLSRVENRLDEGVLHIKAWSDTAVSDPSGQLRVPVVLSGRLPVDRDLVAGEAGGFGMTATIPNAPVGPEVQPMLKLVARDVDGVDSAWTCNVKSAAKSCVTTCTSCRGWARYLLQTAPLRMVLGFN